MARAERAGAPRAPPSKVRIVLTAVALLGLAASMTYLLGQPSDDFVGGPAAVDPRASPLTTTPSAPSASEPVGAVRAAD